MILAAPLTRVKKGIEAPLFGFAALSQLVWITFTFNVVRSGRSSKCSAPPAAACRPRTRPASFTVTSSRRT